MERRNRDEQNGPVETPDHPTAGHNAKHRRTLIREACAKLASLEAERKGLSDQIAEFKNTKIKGELGFKLADFAAVYRLHRLEETDRATFLDTLRETFEAMDIGYQADWLAPSSESGIEEDGQPVGPAAAAGLRAGEAGKLATSNPYPEGSPAAASWYKSWQAGQAKLAEAVGAGPQPQV